MSASTLEANSYVFQAGRYGEEDLYGPQDDVLGRFETPAVEGPMRTERAQILADTFARALYLDDSASVGLDWIDGHVRLQTHLSAADIREIMQESTAAIHNNKEAK